MATRRQAPKKKALPKSAYASPPKPAKKKKAQPKKAAEEGGVFTGLGQMAGNALGSALGGPAGGGWKNS